MSTKEFTSDEIRETELVTEEPPQKNTRNQGIAEETDGGWIAWLQVAGSFVLYFNHL